MLSVILPLTTGELVVEFHNSEAFNKSDYWRHHICESDTPDANWVLERLIEIVPQPDQKAARISPAIIQFSQTIWQSWCDFTHWVALDPQGGCRPYMRGRHVMRASPHFWKRIGRSDLMSMISPEARVLPELEEKRESKRKNARGAASSRP